MEYIIIAALVIASAAVLLHNMLTGWRNGSACAACRRPCSQAGSNAHCLPCEEGEEHVEA